MKVLSKLKAPAIAGVIREKTSKAAIAEIKNCMYDGADMIDLHMSCLENADVENLKEIVNSSKLPILALNYNRTYDWKDTGFSEEEREESGVVKQVLQKGYKNKEKVIRYAKVSVIK